MKARFEEETGYLYIEDAQDGIKILSKDRYTELKRSADEADSLRDQLKELEGMKILSEDEYNDLKEQLHKAEHYVEYLNDDLANERQDNKSLTAQVSNLKMLLELETCNRAIAEFGNVREKEAHYLSGMMIGLLQRQAPAIPIDKTIQDEIANAILEILKKHPRIVSMYNDYLIDYNNKLLDCEKK